MSARAASSLPRATAERCALIASTAPTVEITTAARSASGTSAAGGPSSSLLLKERLNSSSAKPSTTAAIWDGRHTSLHTQLTKLEQDQQTTAAPSRATDSREFRVTTKDPAQCRHAAPRRRIQELTLFLDWKSTRLTSVTNAYFLSRPLLQKHTKNTKPTN